MHADAGTVTEEGYFVFVQQLVVRITGGIPLPTSSSVQEGASAVVDVTIDGLVPATTHGNAIVADDDTGDDGSSPAIVVVERRRRRRRNKKDIKIKKKKKKEIGGMGAHGGGSVGERGVMQVLHQDAVG